MVITNIKLIETFKSLKYGTDNVTLPALNLLSIEDTVVFNSPFINSITVIVENFFKLLKLFKIYTN